MNDPHSSSSRQEPTEDLTTLHVRRALRGDAGSLEWVVARFTPILLAQAEYRLGKQLRHHVDAEDLVSDTWLRTLPELSRFQLTGPRATPLLMRFLSRVLLNRVNTLYQKFLRGKPIQRSGDVPDSDVRFGELPANSMGVVSLVVKRELAGLMTETLHGLSSEDREILILRGIEQNDIEEIAVLLGISRNLVSVRYRRALDRLRQRMPKTVFDEFPSPE